MTDWVAFTEQKFNIQLKRASQSGEYAGPCPWCGGRDRFHVWERGNYWCRPGAGHCGKSGWLDELDGAERLTPEQMMEMRLAAVERAQADLARRVSALEQMHRSEDHLQYHANLNHHPEAVEYWLSEGILGQSMAKFQLGYCPSCPTAPGFASYTIPITYRGELYNIRHRLARPPDKGGKYRPHMAGLPSMIFNADDLDRDTPTILLLEGEKKAIVVSQETGLACVATMGMQSFKRGWAEKFNRFTRVYVAFDPDATEKAAEVAGYFKGRGRVVELPAKADDFFTLWHGRRADFLHHLRTARPV